MVTICCVCQRQKSGEHWVKRPAPLSELASHGYCPACARKAMEEIREYRQSHPAIAM